MIDYHVDVARRLITTRVAGQVSFGDLANHLQRIYRDPKFSAEFNGLVVASDAAAVPSPAVVAVMKPLVRAWSLRRAGVKWAFVLPDAASRNQAETILHDLKLSAVVSRCFTSEAAAVAWLEPVAAPSAAR